MGPKQIVQVVVAASAAVVLCWVRGLCGVPGWLVKSMVSPGSRSM
jgi:hypothetical protein